VGRDVHEAVRWLENKCLGSYFAFLRRKVPNFNEITGNCREKLVSHQLFTTIVCDFSGHHPTFKLALGRVIRSFVVPVTTEQLFECLLGPVKSLSPPRARLIPVVIDALPVNGSGDAISKIGFRPFLLQYFVDRPSEFRRFATSLSEYGIEYVFRVAKAYLSTTRAYYSDDAKRAVSN
jgi:hypothetical protein